MNYHSAIEELNKLSMFGIKLGLDNVKAILEACGNPQDKLHFIHVAGTNGKGSTSSLLHASLVECGLNVGIYTSPHLVCVRERIRVNGEPISEQDFASVAKFVFGRLEELNETRGEHEKCSPTYFEILTVMAVFYFSLHHVSFVVWETGMGGRLDATNVITPVASVITNVGLEHCTYLGDTVEEIAREKAGIIKPGVPVFYGGDTGVAGKVVEKAARTTGARCFKKGLDYTIEKYTFEHNSQFRQKTRVTFANMDAINVSTTLWGTHQADNVGLTAAVLKYLAIKFKVNFDTAVEGMERALWPGRLHFVTQEFPVAGGEPLVRRLLFDGAHNGHAVGSMVNSLEEAFPGKKWDIAIGLLQDKSHRDIFDRLSKIAGSIMLVRVPNPRSFEPDEIAPVLQRKYPSVAVSVVNWEELPSIANGRTLLVTGSLYLIGEVLKDMHGEELPDIISARAVEVDA